jgi:hypothetical protein
MAGGALGLRAHRSTAALGAAISAAVLKRGAQLSATTVGTVSTQQSGNFLAGERICVGVEVGGGLRRSPRAMREPT